MATKAEKEIVIKEDDFKTLNVYQRFFMAKEKLLNTKMDKTGKNPHMKYLYFSLEDIVPVVEKILQEVRLAAYVTYPSAFIAELYIINVDNPEEKIVVQAPMKTFEDVPYGNQPTLVVQYLGAEFTYMRRYLYLAAFNLVENDLLDGDELPKPIPQPVTKPSATQTATVGSVVQPQVNVAKNTIVSTLTQANGNAEPLMLENLKNKCKELTEKTSDPEIQKVILQIATETNKFTSGSKARVEQFMMAVQNQLQKIQESTLSIKVDPTADLPF